MSVTGTPAISYTVVQHGKTLHTRHLGYRDVSAGLQANDQTRFSINSMSKSLVSALAGIIAASGSVDLNAPVKKYLPDFVCYDSRLSDQITLVDLLSHRTGITNYDQIWLGSHNAVLIDRDQVIQTFATLKPCGRFRDSFVYNNWGYELVGMVLEKVTGKDLDILLQEHIFEPLGLTRTSTDWNFDDSNNAKAYFVMQDLSVTEVGRPTIGKGTVMEAAGGVKSTIEDLTVLYSEYLHAIISQFESRSDSTNGSVFRHCRDIVTSHSRFPGPSLREQGYGLGLARGQLPGQLGRVSLTHAVGPEPFVGRDSEPKLVLYHHGAMPGSTTCVHLLPEENVFIIVLQNSSSPLDTADFVSQCLLEKFLDTKTPNNYKQLSQAYAQQGLGHQERVRQKLEEKRNSNTTPKKLQAYIGKYWNDIHNFCIEVCEADGKLQMRLQGLESEAFALNHYENDTFTWWMPHDEVARRGRFIAGYDASYYLITFSGKDDEFDTLHWAWDSNLADEASLFKK